MHPAMQHLAQLPVSERLDIVQDLWDSIVAAQEKLPIQQWHRELVKARLAEENSQTEETGMSRDQVCQQVDERRGIST